MSCSLSKRQHTVWPRRGRRGFTLLEILLAVSLLAVTATITFMTFSAATTAWQRGTALVDRLHHGDFVMHQLMLGLRSAYYTRQEHGFYQINTGSGENAEDEISWVKLGGALVGHEERFAETPHRVRFFVGSTADGETGAMMASWRLAGQMEDFDPDAVETKLLSPRVVGFSCRTAWEYDDQDEIAWLDEWEETNRVPVLVEVTLFLEPIEEGDKPLEMKRIAPIRAAVQSWRRP